MPIDTPGIVRTDERRTAVIRLVIPKASIREVMGPGIGELMATVQQQGIGPAGPWFTRHFRIDPDEWDFEIGVPVTAAVTPAGRVTAGSLPAATVARTVHRGAYEGLGDAWGELDRWIRTNGRVPGREAWEYYAVGPEASADPADWRTELNRPLSDQS